MKKECRVWTIKDNYRLGDDIQSKVLAFAFGLSAEIERNLISQRTKEALARKRAEGGKWWHDKGQRLRLNPKCAKRHEWIVQKLAEGKQKLWIAKRLHVSPCTLYRYLIYTGLYTPKHCNRECWIKYGIFHQRATKQGFDIVIGNPPYVTQNKDDYPMYEWNTDLYKMFFEAGIKSYMTDDAILCYITPKFYMLNLACNSLQ